MVILCSYCIHLRWETRSRVGYLTYEHLWETQLPAAAQFQWVACAGSPGENGTGVCASAAPPAALQWCSQWYSRPAVGSSLQCWWNSPNWIQRIFINTTVVTLTPVFPTILDISCLRTVSISPWNHHNKPMFPVVPYEPLLISSVLEHTLSMGSSSEPDLCWCRTPPPRWQTKTSRVSETT